MLRLHARRIQRQPGPRRLKSASLPQSWSCTGVGTHLAFLTFWRAFIDAWMDEFRVALHGCKKLVLCAPNPASVISCHTKEQATSKGNAPDLLVHARARGADLVLRDGIGLEDVGEAARADLDGSGRGGAREGVREGLLDLDGFLQRAGGGSARRPGKGKNGCGFTSGMCGCGRLVPATGLETVSALDPLACKVSPSVRSVSPTDPW